MKVSIITIAILFYTSTYAMTGLEFMQSSIREQNTVCDQLIIYYVSQGYQKVPDWIDLKMEIDNHIRRWGSGNKNIEDIAIEAAKAKGMTQWR